MRKNPFAPRQRELAIRREFQWHGSGPAEGGLQHVASLVITHRVNRQTMARQNAFVAVAAPQVLQRPDLTCPTDDVERIDHERRVDSNWQHEFLKRRGFSTGPGGTRVGQCHLAHMQRLQPGGTVPQSGPIPCEVNVFERKRERSRRFIRLRIAQAVDQFADVPAVAHSAADALNLQAAARGHVALYDLQQGAEGLGARRPIPQPPKRQHEHQTQTREDPGAVAHHPLGARQRRLRRLGLLGLFRVFRFHQKLNPRFMCRRTLRSCAP